MHALREYAAPSPEVWSVSLQLSRKRNLQLKKQVKEEIFFKKLEYN